MQTIIASGSEVEIAVSAATEMLKKKVRATVVSMPCVEKFLEEPASFKNKILGSGLLIIVEAGLSLGWRTFFDDLSNVVTVESFGSSAPKDQLYNHFNITKENIISKAYKLIGR